MQPNLFLPFAVSLLLTLFAPLALSQTYDYVEDEGISLWEEEGFIDSTGEESEFETEDGQYVSEEEVKLQEEAMRRAQVPGLNVAEALEKDKKLLPDNILYGIGTGVVIGGWFALLQGENARQNVQFVSVGIVGGVLLGIMVGTKSLYKEAVHWPLDEFERKFDTDFTPTDEIKAEIALIDYQYRF